MTRGLIFYVLLSMSVACGSYSLAPPVRVAIGSIPEIIDPGAGEVRLSGGWPLGWLGGELGARVALTSELGLEGTALALPGESGGVMMGSVLVRYAPFEHPWIRFAMIGGPAIGCGALGVERSDVGEDPEYSCATTLAGGGIVGLDLGARLHETTALFLGARYQLTKAEDIPTTHWGLIGGGIRIDIAWSFIAAEASALMFDNETVHGAVAVWHLTVGATWQGHPTPNGGSL